MSNKDNSAKQQVELLRVQVRRIALAWEVLRRTGNTPFTRACAESQMHDAIEALQGMIEE